MFAISGDPASGASEGTGPPTANLPAVISALLMLRRVGKALGYAVREENFLPVLSAGVLLLLLGTLAYTLGAGWNVVDAAYFALSTLTTTSVSDPDLVLQEGWLKVFTMAYQLIGIGILVEVLRRLGVAFVTVREQESQPPAA